MNEDYIYNTLVGLLHEIPTNKAPRCVQWRELMASIESDVKMIIGNLHEQGRIIGKRDVNKNPLLFIPNES